MELMGIKSFSLPMTDPWDEQVYLPTWMVDFYGFHVGKYASPMDPMGESIYSWNI